MVGMKPSNVRNAPREGTRRKKISMQHMLGDWSGLIEGCNCPRCRDCKQDSTKSVVKTVNIVNVPMKVDVVNGDNSSGLTQSENVNDKGTELSIIDNNFQDSLQLNLKKELLTDFDDTDMEVSAFETTVYSQDEALSSQFSNNQKIGVSEHSSSLYEEELSFSTENSHNPNKRKYLEMEQSTHSETSAVPIKSEPLEYLDTSQEKDDVSIEVSNEDFMRVFDENVEDVSTMFRKLDDDPLNYVECSVCFKKIKESSMKQHYRTHTGLRPHVCNVCNAQFTRRGDVYRHKRVVHGKLKPYVCKKCEKTFPDRNVLISHLLNHDKVVYYECPTCKFRFGKKDYYDNHTKFIHPSVEEPKTIIHKEDDVEAQLRELEEEENLAEIDSINSNKECLKTLDKVNEEISNETFETDDQVCDDSTQSDLNKGDPNEKLEDETLNSNSEQKENTDKSVQLPSVQIQTVSKTNSKDEDMVNKILDAAVLQATNTLEKLSAARRSKMKNRNKVQEKTEVKLMIKVMVDGVLEEFLMEVEIEDEFDLQSESTMKLIVSLINEVCSDRSKIEGPIQVELHNPSESINNNIS